MGDGSVFKMQKATGETNSVKADVLLKVSQGAANSSAVQSGASKKANPASPK